LEQERQKNIEQSLDGSRALGSVRAAFPQPGCSWPGVFSQFEVPRFLFLALAHGNPPCQRDGRLPPHPLPGGPQVNL